MEIEKLFVVCGARRTGTTLLAAVLSADGTTPMLPGESQLLWRWLEIFRWAKEDFNIRALPFFADEGEYSRFYRHLLREFVAHCGTHFDHSSSLVLKSPEVSLYFPEVWELMPEARVLVTTRDPRDQVASEWRVIDKRRGSEEDLRILRERDFQILAENYNRYYRPVLDVTQQCPERIHYQRYEDLVLTPEDAITKLDDGARPQGL